MLVSPGYVWVVSTCHDSDLVGKQRETHSVRPKGKRNILQDLEVKIPWASSRSPTAIPEAKAKAAAAFLRRRWISRRPWFVFALVWLAGANRQGMRNGMTPIKHPTGGFL